MVSGGSRLPHPGTRIQRWQTAEHVLHLRCADGPLTVKSRGMPVGTWVTATKGSASAAANLVSSPVGGRGVQ